MKVRSSIQKQERNARGGGCGEYEEWSSSVPLEFACTNLFTIMLKPMHVDGQQVKSNSHGNKGPI